MLSDDLRLVTKKILQSLKTSDKETSPAPKKCLSFERLYRNLGLYY